LKLAPIEFQHLVKPSRTIEFLIGPANGESHAKSSIVACQFDSKLGGEILVRALGGFVSLLKMRTLLTIGMIGVLSGCLQLREDKIIVRAKLPVDHEYAGNGRLCMRVINNNEFKYETLKLCQDEIVVSNSSFSFNTTLESHIPRGVDLIEVASVDKIRFSVERKAEGSDKVEVFNYQGILQRISRDNQGIKVDLEFVAANRHKVAPLADIEYGCNLYFNRNYHLDHNPEVAVQTCVAWKISPSGSSLCRDRVDNNRPISNAVAFNKQMECLEDVAFEQGTLK